MDQFITAYRDALEKYAKFDGRLGVGGFWRFVAVNIAITVILAILANIGSIFFIVYMLYALALLIPSLAAAVRRLHDTGKSGWFILVGLIPIVGFILLIVWYVQAGDPATNEHGAPPAT